VSHRGETEEGREGGCLVVLEELSGEFFKKRLCHREAEKSATGLLNKFTNGGVREVREGGEEGRDEDSLELSELDDVSLSYASIAIFQFLEHTATDTDTGRERGEV
jgi:hypothetical protein